MKYTFAARRLGTLNRLGAMKWAILMSAIGFAYALITSASPSASATSSDLSSRVLATNCTRIPTEFVTGSDLGAAIVGSNFTRQILARFGFRPHTFTFGQFSSGGTSLTISDAGKLQGKVTTAGASIFQVNVSDPSIGVPPPPISKNFQITGVAQQFADMPLHFETGAPVLPGTTTQTIQLSTAVSGDVYFYSIAANGGVPPYKYSLVAQVGSRFLPQGLAFDFTNALFYGKPVLPTLPGSPAKIIVLLQDASGSQVTGTFLLDILQGTITSQAVATSGSMQLNFGNDNLEDSLSLSLILDKSQLNAQGIRTAADLNGLPIQMNFGGFQLPPLAQKNSTTKIITKFNSKGTINVGKPSFVAGDTIPLHNVKDVVYSIKLDPKTGILTANFRNVSMIRAIGANFSSFEDQTDTTFRGPVIPINVRIGLTADVDLTAAKATDVLDQTDVIKFVYKRSGSVARGTARFNDNLAPAGIFLINKVSGIEQQVTTDVLQNIKEDRLFLTMKGLMRQPGAKPVIPGTGDSVSVFINRLCLGMFPASSFAVKGSQLIFSNDDPSKGLKDLIIDNKKGTVLITTHGLAPNVDLFGADVLIAGEPETVPITLTISGPDIHNATFDGQSTVTLFRKGKGISNK